MRKQFFGRQLAADDIDPDSFLLERADTFFGQLLGLSFREKLQSNIEWRWRDFEHADERVTTSVSNHIPFAKHRDLTFAHGKGHSRRIGDDRTCACKKSWNWNSHRTAARDLFHLIEQLVHRCDIIA